MTPKFRVGDVISDNESIVEITGINERGYTISSGEIDNDANVVAWVIPFENQFNWELVEQKSTWSEEDEYVFSKVLNWMLIVNPTSSIFEKLSKEQFIERFKSFKERIKGGITV